MSGIIIKETQSKIDHPSRDPLREKKIKAGQQRLRNGSLKFADRGEKEDYEKRVKANPNNVYGNPAWYPPISIRSAMNDIREAKICKTDGCGGCCVYADGYICPRCHEQN